MARAKKRSDDDEPAFILNAREPSHGVGIFVKKDAERRTYRFVDGEERSFKEAYCQLYIKPAYHVAAEVKAKLQPPKPKAVPVPPKAVNEALEAQIRARPDEPGPYLVYADWLQQRQDPRGNLITVQSQLADAPRKKELLDAEKKLLDAHRVYFVPPALDEALRLPRRGGARCEVTWNHGFFAHVRLAKAPTPAAQEIDLDVVAREVLAHPSAKFLRSLTVGQLGTPSYTYIPIVSAIAKQKHPLLDELCIGDFGPGDIELASTRAGNVSPLFRIAPALTKLVIKAGSLRFDGAIAHARVREVHITATELAGEHVRALLAADLPALESLAIITERFTLDTPDITRLTEGKLFPALRHLTLRGTRKTRAVVDALLDSPLVARLESLDLVGGDLAEATIHTAFARREQLAKLQLRTSDRKRFPITESQVVKKSPDAASMTAARKLARADKWLALGFDRRRDRVWGEYEGSDHYYVFAQLSGRQVGCACGSPKDPCKHALALLLLTANQHEFPEIPVPDALVRWASVWRPTYGRDADEW